VPAQPAAQAGLALRAADAAGGPSFRDRNRLRRRLRYLRRVRELGFRDVGGLVFDLHRFGREGSGLVAGKLGALAAVDVELRALERVLDDRQDYVVLREPGIAACPRCAALHGSDAHFCPSCGLRLDGPQAIAEVGDAPAALRAASRRTDATALPAGGAAPPAFEPSSPAAPPATAEPAGGAVEPPTTTQPAVEPGAEPGQSPHAP